MSKNTSLSLPLLLKGYTLMYTSRFLEEQMILWLRKGYISKWFSGIGQEAISVGAACAAQEDEYLLTVHRNLGAFIARGVPIRRLVSQYMGKSLGFTGGRDRSFHFGSHEHGIVGMISHLAAQLCVADGIALGSQLKQTGNAVIAFTGEGGTSEGDFHEALNIASVWNLPIVFIIENNGYALSTPTRQQYACKNLSDKAIGYGIEGLRVDGNSFISVYHAVSEALNRARGGFGPTLIECCTFRMKGHEEASGVKYVPSELFEEWSRKDPLHSLIKTMSKLKDFDQGIIPSLEETAREEVNRELEYAFASDDITPSIEKELRAVYSTTKHSLRAQTTDSHQLRFIDAISEGLRLAMEYIPELILMGQDIAEYGGVFKVTEGFLEQFGHERVRNTPICESGIIGTAAGLAMVGIPSVVEMQFADFVSCGFNQVVNNLAKSYYRWGQHMPVVIRMPSGAGSAAGPFHSQSVEGWFTQVPGLKVVYPSSPDDAKGLLLSSIVDNNPVLFFEHKALYRSVKSQVPKGIYFEELGKAKIIEEGTDLTIITYGAGVHWSREVISDFKENSFEIVDLRTLVPLDVLTITASVKKTGKVIILNEPSLSYSPSAEVASIVASQCFEYLDGPVLRVGSLDTPVPFNKSLESQYLPVDRLKEAVSYLLHY